MNGTETPYHFIFDIGNVLLNFDLPALQARIARETGTPEDRIAAEWTAPETVSVEAGLTDPQTYYNAFARRMSLTWTYDQWVDAWSTIYSVNERGYGLMAELHRQGRPVHMLSNLAPYNVPAIKKVLPDFFPEGVGTFFSFNLKAHKPDPAIYRTVADALGVPPQQCIFIDDAQTNVNAARSIGMHAITYSDRNAGEVATYVSTFK